MLGVETRLPQRGAVARLATLFLASRRNDGLGVSLAARFGVAMRVNAKSIWSLVKEAAEDWDNDNASSLAAALACYTLLSIAPLVVMAVSIGGMLFGRDAARGQIANELGSIVGSEAANAIQSIAANAKDPAPGIISTVVGAVVLLLGASGVFIELHSALNTIWEVKPKPGRGVMGFIRDRLFSFAMVMAVAFLLLVSLVLSAFLAAVGHFFAETLPGGEFLWQVVNFLVSLGVTTLLFALIYKYVPDAEIVWRDVWLGAAVTAVLFSIGKLLLALYIGKSSFASSFGAAGSLVALVVWVYYSSQIVFLGAEFTQAWARRFGGRIRPDSDAVPIAQGGPAQKLGPEAAQH